jgi:hypothetical protein
MRLKKKSVLLLAVSIGFTVVVILLGPLGMTAIVQAAPNTILVTFTDTSPIQYEDLEGNVIGEGVHVGELRCVGDICNQKIEFKPVWPQPTTDTVVFTYKFKSRGAFDPLDERVVVSGTGTISSGSPKIRFSFTGFFQNNGDGTVQVTYVASTSDASFFIPAAPGILTFTSID